MPQEWLAHSAQASYGRGTEVGSPQVAKAAVSAWQDDQLTELGSWLGSLDTSWGPKAIGDFRAREWSASCCVLIKELGGTGIESEAGNGWQFGT